MFLMLGFPEPNLHARQDFLICVEMLFFAFAHLFVFPPEVCRVASLPFRLFFDSMKATIWRAAA